jgi:hypothetical protein
MDWDFSSERVTNLALNRQNQFSSDSALSVHKAPLFLLGLSLLVDLYFFEDENTAAEGQADEGQRDADV